MNPIPRPQFTLRALLVAMLVVGAFFGGMAVQRTSDEAKFQHLAATIEEIQKETDELAAENRSLVTKLVRTQLERDSLARLAKEAKQELDEDQKRLQRKFEAFERVDAKFRQPKTGSDAAKER